jgi:prepilin-type N-terminal cleavage/methylation domain-containing protein
MIVTAKATLRGVTLVELVVVMVILAVLVAAILPILSGGFNTYFAGRDIMSTDTQVRPAVERIARELRQIRSATATDLTIATPSQISFNDFNSNAVVYSYSSATGTINRNGQPLTDRVGALSFFYWQSNVISTAASPGTVSYVTVQVTATAGSVSAVYRTTVQPWAF